MVPISKFLSPISAYIFAVIVILSSQITAFAQSQPPGLPAYQNSTSLLESRVTDLMGRLTQDEKLSILSLNNRTAEAQLDGPGIPRLGIRPLRTTDGPQGLRVARSTYFPVGVVMASTWDAPLIGQVGAAIGTEARALGRQIVYGPALNLQRTPQGGRFFENFSEDPLLTSQMAVKYIEGMQSQGIASCPKHFFGNDQEKGRHSVSSEMDERTMREFDLRPFESAVTRAHAWAMMVAFNRVNGEFVVESKPFVTDLLRNVWGWDGVAIGDWGSMHSTSASMNAGIDMEMPVPAIYSSLSLSKALAAGTIAQTEIDQAVLRILRLSVRTGLADVPPAAVSTTVDCPEHRALALKVAQEGVTLLKNEGQILPIDRTAIKSIAVIGPNAQETQLGGRWSADTPYFYEVGILEGIQKRAGAIDVQYAQGCNRFGDTPDAMIQTAVDIASKSDVAIIVVGTDKSYLGEEEDVPNLNLPGAQDKLIQAVTAVNKHTIVVLNNGMPILMDKWINQTPGLIEDWYGGQEQGNAIAGILFGEISPSGKLPCTIAVKREDYSDWPNYPGDNQTVKYAEGIYVGYRHFDKANITPLFPFGYGLSYTTFEYSHPRVPRSIEMGETAAVSVHVKNIGNRDGDEIVELYIRDKKPLIDRAVRELKGFARVELKPGEEKVVSIPIDTDSFSYWDVVHHRWQANPGQYSIEFGASSRDIRASSNLALRAISE